MATFVFLFFRGDVFLLDDPFSYLDFTSTKKILKKMKTKPALKEKTFVITSTNLDLIELVDKVAYMDGGRMTFFGPAERFKVRSEYAEMEAIQKNFHEAFSKSQISFKEVSACVLHLIAG